MRHPDTKSSMTNDRLKIGTINRLTIDRITEPGIFLTAGDGEAVLLPRRYVTQTMAVGEMLDVFVTTDSEDRPVALTQKPGAMVGEFGYFSVVDTTRDGAYLDWGLPKDLFVPRALQKRPMHVGEKRVVRVVIDEMTGRPVGDEHILRYLDTDVSEFTACQKVRLLILAKTPLGFKAIVNNTALGMLYDSEIDRPPHVGLSLEGYIRRIRPDGKIDLSLEPLGQAAKDDALDRVRSLLDHNNGRLGLTSKSDPETILRLTGLSKKSFKSAVSSLVASGEIAIDDGCIRKTV